MKTIMNDSPIKTLEQVRQFLEGRAAVKLSIDAKENRYTWIQSTLVQFHYLLLSKADKGLMLSFLQKVSWVREHQRSDEGQAFRGNGKLKS
jgi:hypothetical protein